MPTPIHILLLEDNPPDAYLLNKHATRDPRRPTTVDHSATLAEACDALRGGRYDLILADLGLPDSEGLETLEALRGTCGDTPIVVITGRDDVTLSEACLAQGAQEYLVKGTVEEALPKLLHNTLRRVRLQAEIREQEQRFRSFFEGAPVFGYIVSLEGHIVDVNQAALAALGYDRYALIGLPMLNLYTPESRPAAQRAFETWRETGRVNDVELDVLRQDGTRRTVLLDISSLHYDDDRITASISLQRDITERRRAEAKSAKMEARLRQQQKLDSIGTLASGMAHEINNPMAIILNSVELLGDAIDTEDFEARQDLQNIEDAGTRVSGLVGKLLSFAREDSGRPSPVPVRALIEDAVTLIHGVLRRDGISVDVDVAPDLPEVPCCRSQIQQVLMNLLTNARDALNQRSLERTTDPTVEIAARLVTTDGRPCLRITVADCGDGMSPEVAERIFDPFFTTKGPDKGTGLGLSVSHGIVTEHGGALHVDSAPGEGARFHIDLPLAPE